MPQQVVFVFPKTAKLLTAADFKLIFNNRPCKKSEHFIVYKRQTKQPPRLGIVIGKKYASRAVTRNLLKRFIRETFRIHQTPLQGWDILIRLRVQIDQHRFRSASSDAFKREFTKEIHCLFTTLLEQIR